MKKIFVLGDSIAIHYGPYLNDMLLGSYDYLFKKGQADALKDLDRPFAGNGGDSRMVLSFLRNQYFNSEMNYDILVLNCGLHDIKIDRVTGDIQVPPNEYKENLFDIINLVKERSIKLIWVTTTKVDDKIHNSNTNAFFRNNKNVLEYNAIAKALMKVNNVPSIDLYKFTEIFGTEAYCDHVHYKSEIRKLQAAYISGYINCLLKE